jgi:hypothetical protein
MARKVSNAEASKILLEILNKGNVSNGHSPQNGNTQNFPKPQRIRLLPLYFNSRGRGGKIVFVGS